jgi:hypothetical protein
MAGQQCVRVAWKMSGKNSAEVYSLDARIQGATGETPTTQTDRGGG